MGSDDWSCKLRDFIGLFHVFCIYKLWLLACGIFHSGNSCTCDWPVIATHFLLLDYLGELQYEGLSLSYLISCSVHLEVFSWRPSLYWRENRGRWLCRNGEVYGDLGGMKGGKIVIRVNCMREKSISKSESQNRTKQEGNY